MNRPIFPDAPPEDECPLGRLDLEAGGCTCISECALGYPEEVESE